MRVDRADFDDLVTLVTQAPTWEKERLAGIRILLRAIADGKPDAPGADPRPLDVEARARDAQGAGPACVERVPGGEAAARRARELARPPARGERREARPDRRSSSRSRSARRCSHRPRATRRARRSCSTRRASVWATIHEVALALSENLPAPKQPSSSRRRRRRRKKKPGATEAGTTPETQAQPPEGGGEGQPAAPRRRRRRRKPSDAAVAVAGEGEKADAGGDEHGADGGRARCRS